MHLCMVLLQYEKAIMDVVEETKNLPEALAETGEVQPCGLRRAASCPACCVCFCLPGGEPTASAS